MNINEQVHSELPAPLCNIDIIHKANIVPVMAEIMVTKFYVIFPCGTVL